MSTIYTLTEATRHTAEVVNAARYGHEPVVITDHGKTAAVVISPETMARYRALENAADQKTLDALNARGPVWVENDEAQQMMSQWLDEADAADQSR